MKAADNLIFQIAIFAKCTHFPLQMFDLIVQIHTFSKALRSVETKEESSRSLYLLMSNVSLQKFSISINLNGEIIIHTVLSSSDRNCSAVWRHSTIDSTSPFPQLTSNSPSELLTRIYAVFTLLLLLLFPEMVFLMDQLSPAYVQLDLVLSARIFLNTKCFSESQIELISANSISLRLPFG